jgi:hypothetical protein
MKKIAIFAALSVLALSLPSLQAEAGQRGASGYAPGQKAKAPGARDAKYYAPGQRMKRGERRPTGTTGASGFAPGHLKDSATTTGSRR